MKLLSQDLYFFKIPFYLTVSLPFLLITGPFLADAAVSLCAFLFLINIFINPINKYFKSKFFIFFIFFWLTIVISSLFSSDILYSLKSSFFYLRFGVFSLSVWYLLNRDNKLIHYIFYVFIFCFVILIFDGYLQFLTKKNIFGWELYDTRVSSFFKEELILGSYLSRLFPVVLALYIYLNDKKFKNFFIILFILTEILIFLSGERVAFFYLNLSAFFMILMSKNFVRFRLFIIIASIILITSISYLYNSQYKERIFDRTFHQITSDNRINIFSIEHENHYRSALLMFKDYPWFGVGPKLFRKNCGKEKYKISFESCTTHPHNTYVQLLAESGIFSFLQIFSLFLVISYYSLKHLYLKFKKNFYLFSDFQLSLISAMIITLWPIIPTGSFFTNWLNIVYYLPIGILLYSFQSQNR